MKEKDFKSLSIDEQKENINELITSWYKQDSNNRCALVILGNRKNKKDVGESSYTMLGPGGLIMTSLGTTLNKDEDFRDIIVYCLMGSFGRPLSMLNKSGEEEE